MTPHDEFTGLVECKSSRETETSPGPKPITTNKLLESQVELQQQQQQQHEQHAALASESKSDSTPASTPEADPETDTHKPIPKISPQISFPQSLPHSTAIIDTFIKPEKQPDSQKPAVETRRSISKRHNEEVMDNSLESASCSSSEIDERELNSRPNIKRVVYCNFKFNAWYRSPRYFDESSPSGFMHSSPSLHLSKQHIKNEYNKEIEVIRKARKDRLKEKGNSGDFETHNDLLSSDSKPQLEEDGEVGNLIDTLYICDTCFRYTSDAKEMAIHIPKCPYRLQLPGREVYDSPYYQIRKVCGARHLLYVECLSLFAKLFLDHKSICYALETFDFYILTTSVANIQGVNQFAVNNNQVELAEAGQKHNTALKSENPFASGLNTNNRLVHDSINNKSTVFGSEASNKKKGAKPEPAPSLVPTELSSPLSSQRVVGFFSKEKVSWDNYNLACITIFPPFQKRGLGKLLIEYSYYLSRKSKIIGTPERPLSTEGLLTYLKYWSNTISLCISRCYFDWKAEREERLLQIQNLENKAQSGTNGQEKDNVYSGSIQANQNPNNADKSPVFHMSISEISKGTYIKEDDVLKALEYMNVLRKVPSYNYKSLFAQSNNNDDTNVSKGRGDFNFILDMDRVIEWVEKLRVKSSIVPLYEEYCIVRRRTKLHNKDAGRTSGLVASPYTQANQQQGKRDYYEYSFTDDESNNFQDGDDESVDFEPERKSKRKRNRVNRT